MGITTSNRSHTPSDLIRPILLAIGVVILLFLIFEVVEVFWLQDLEMEVLHKLYIVRGLFVSLTAAVLVGWMVVKASDPLLATKDWSEGDRLIKKDRVRKFNNWFILMRWVAVFIAAALVFIVVWVTEWLPQVVWGPLMVAIGTLALLNTVYTFIARREGMISYLLPFQAYADLVILTILLHFSGGIENPLTLMLLIHVFIAGIVLSKLHLFTVTVTAILLLTGMAIGEATGIFNHYTLDIFPHFEHEGAHVHAAHQPIYVTSLVGLMITIFLLTSYFVDTIMNRIRNDELQLEKFADQSLEQRQLIEKALETTGTGLCVCDNRGKPFWINQNWESWFGRKCIDEVTFNDDREEMGCVVPTLRDGKTRVKEVSLTDSGQTWTFQITTAPLLDKDGNIDHAVSLAKDITDQKKAQEQMLHAGKLAAVGELAGKIAHEVNNPIGIISAKCRLLLSDYSAKMDEKVSQELVKITGAADRVSDIAKGLLSYCRPSIGTRKELDVSVPVQNALSMIEQSAQRNRVAIDNRLPAQLPRVNGNADEMQQVFLNLFLNAMDAMPDGGDLVIEVSEPEHAQRPESNYLIIGIRDTGTGVPPQIRQQIFEPFFTTKEEGKGTGLGLSICAGIVRSHDGAIDIQNEPSGGTCVTVQLPVYEKREEAI